MQEEKPSKTLTTGLRLAAAISITAPIIFFILQKHNYKILWRNVDVMYLKSLTNVLNIFQPNNFDREFIMNLHTTKFHDASAIINVNNEEVVNFLKKLPQFQVNNKFSQEKFKQFIKENTDKFDITENILMDIIKEMLVIKKYYEIKINGDMAENIINNIMEKELNHYLSRKKEIYYKIFKLKNIHNKRKEFSLKEQKEAYEKLINEKNLLVYTDKQYEGFLIKKSIKNYNITITEDEIQNYYKNNLKDFKNQTNFHLLILFANTSQELDEIIKKYYKRQISLEEIKNNYPHKIEIINSLKNKEFSNMKNFYNEYGLNTFKTHQHMNNFISMAIIKEEKLPITIHEVKGTIKQKLLEKKIKIQLEKDIFNMKKDIKLMDKNNNYIIKNKDDPYYSLIANSYKINGDIIEIFILNKKINRSIIPFEKVQPIIASYLEKEYIKKENIKYLELNLDLLKKNKSIDINNFQLMEGNINLDTLLNKPKEANYILQNPKNSEYIDKKRFLLVQTVTKYINNVTLNANNHQMIKTTMKNFDDNLVINFYKKIHYFSSMNKHANKILQTIKDFVFNLL